MFRFSFVVLTPEKTLSSLGGGQPNISVVLTRVWGKFAFSGICFRCFEVFNVNIEEVVAFVKMSFVHVYPSILEKNTRIKHWVIWWLLGKKFNSNDRLGFVFFRRFFALYHGHITFKPPFGGMFWVTFSGHQTLT